MSRILPSVVQMGPQIQSFCFGKVLCDEPSLDFSHDVQVQPVANLSGLHNQRQFAFATWYSGAASPPGCVFWEWSPSTLSMASLCLLHDLQVPSVFSSFWPCRFLQVLSLVKEHPALGFKSFFLLACLLAMPRSFFNSIGSCFFAAFAASCPGLCFKNTPFGQGAFLPLSLIAFPLFGQGEALAVIGFLWFRGGKALRKT